MNPESRHYSVLTVNAADNFSTAVSELLSDSKYAPVDSVTSISAAKRAVIERSYDIVIINSPLADGVGSGFAIDVCNSLHTVALLLLKNDVYAELYEKNASNGVFVMSKPTSKPMLAFALDWLCSARELLSKTETKSATLQDKMETIHLVNRAKLLLVTEMKMDEATAHRYIEKTAMDECVSRLVVAQRIIKRFS